MLEDGPQGRPSIAQYALVCGSRWVNPNQSRPCGGDCIALARSHMTVPQACKPAIIAIIDWSWLRRLCTWKELLQRVVYPMGILAALTRAVKRECIR
jgi:hypothetical protein